MAPLLYREHGHHDLDFLTGKDLTIRNIRTSIKGNAVNESSNRLVEIIIFAQLDPQHVSFEKYQMRYKCYIKELSSFSRSKSNRTTTTLGDYCKKILLSIPSSILTYKGFHVTGAHTWNNISTKQATLISLLSIL